MSTTSAQDESDKLSTPPNVSPLREALAKLEGAHMQIEEVEREAAKKRMDAGECRDDAQHAFMREARRTVREFLYYLPESLEEVTLPTSITELLLAGFRYERPASAYHYAPRALMDEQMLHRFVDDILREPTLPWRVKERRADSLMDVMTPVDIAQQPIVLVRTTS